MFLIFGEKKFVINKFLLHWKDQINFAFDEAQPFCLSIEGRFLFIKLNIFPFAEGEGFFHNFNLIFYGFVQGLLSYLIFLQNLVGEGIDAKFISGCQSIVVFPILIDLDVCNKELSIRSD